MGTTPAQATLEMDFSSGGGFSLSSNGTSVINNSQLYIIKTDGNKRLQLFKQSQLTVKRQGSTITAAGANDNYAATITLTQSDKNTINYSFHGVLKQATEVDKPVFLSLTQGLFNANVLAGKTFRATLKNGKTVSGAIPIWPAKDGLWPIADNYRVLEIDSRLGLLKLTVSSDSPSNVTFADARRRQLSWARPAPIFYSGVTETEALKTNVPVDFSMQIQLTPLAPQSHLPKSISVTSKRGKNISIAAQPIVPKLRNADISLDQFYDLADAKSLKVLLPPGDNRPLVAVQSLFKDADVTLPKPQLVQNDSPVYEISIGTTSPKSAARTNSQWLKIAEGYRINVDAQGIQIQSSTAQGLFYGVQTLAQMVKSQGAGKVHCPFATITDSPSLGFRGTHWFPSGNGFEFDKKLIRLMAHLKMNAVVMQLDSVEFDSHPKMATANAISTSQLKELVALCRANYIEPIPLINCLGHAGWAFKNGANESLKEWPGNTREISANNPQTISFLQDLFKETIEIFHPKYFHIGHDEVRSEPNSKHTYNKPGLTQAEWFSESVNRWHDWFKSRNITTMMWDDMAISKGESGSAHGNASSTQEAEKLRVSLPKDIIMCDWGPTLRSMQVMQKSGFTVLACPSGNDDQIATSTQDAISTGINGTLQLTWAGYSPDETSLTKYSHYFTSFVTGADYAWSGRREKSQELPYDPKEYFSQYWYGSHRFAENPTFFSNMLPLPSGSSASWESSDNLKALQPFFALGEKAVYDGIPFDLSSEQLITMANDGSHMAPPEAVSSLSIRINSQKAQQIVLLHTALWMVRAGQKIATMEVQYKDGTKSTFALDSGGSVLPLRGSTNSATASAIYLEKESDSNTTHLTLARIKNPFPEKEIVALHFEPANPQSGYALAGITLLE